MEVWGTPKFPNRTERESQHYQGLTDGRTDRQTVWAQAARPLCERGVGQPLLQAGRQKPDRPTVVPKHPLASVCFGDRQRRALLTPSPQHWQRDVLHTPRVACHLREPDALRSTFQL